MPIDALLGKDVLFPLSCDKGGRGQLWDVPSPGLIEVIEQCERFQQRFVSFSGLKLEGGEQLFGVLAQLRVATYQNFDGIDLGRGGRELLRFLHCPDKALAISRTDSMAT